MKVEDTSNAFTSKWGFTTSRSRSLNMGKIRGKDTTPEIMLRHSLWGNGLRYRINYKKVTGKPDIVFTKRKIAIFVDGAFWHGYRWDDKRKRMKNNSSYWEMKISRNIRRDSEVIKTLNAEGWIVLRFWDHNIKKRLSDCVDLIQQLWNKRE